MGENEGNITTEYGRWYTTNLIHAIERCGISIEQAINVFNQLYEMITDRKAYMEFAYEDHERGLEITDGALMMLLDGLTEGTE